jgi:hypothetical protein
MAVFRVEKTKDYTVMSNYHLRDKNISLKAKGLLSWMLSNTDDWDYTVAGIVAVMKESRDAINSALCELEDYGYLTRKQVRSSDGKFSDVEYIISEKPITENPISENPQQINTNTNNKLKKDKEGEQAPPTKPKKSSSKKSYKDIYEAEENIFIKEHLVSFVDSLKKDKRIPSVKDVEKWAKDLRELSGNDKKLATQLVQQSIDYGYYGIYPLKKSYNGGAQKKSPAISEPASKEDKMKNPDGSYVVF